MFSAISWETFISTVGGLVGGYYLLTVFLLYHREITSWVKSHGGHSQTNIPTPQPIEHQRSSKAVNSILGNINTDERIVTPRTSSIDAEDLSFAATSENDGEVVNPVSVSRAQYDHLIIGSVADLLQEIKTVIQLITECDSDKVESASLFRTLLQRYPNIKSSDYRDAISLYICQAAQAQFSFTLELQEALSWWEDEKNIRK